MSKDVTPALILDEYASALRGDWSCIDGRSEKTALGHLSAQIRATGNQSLEEDEIHALREALDVCLEGEGHWTEHCSPKRCGSEAAA